MSTVTRKRFVMITVFAAIGALVVLLLYLLAPGPAIDPIEGIVGADIDGGPESFTIEGYAREPLAPGESAALDLAITNPHGVAISVSDLDVTVRDVSAPNSDDLHPCTLGDFTVDQVSNDLDLNLAANAKSALSSLGLPESLWPRVGMLDRAVNQDGCKGASVTLEYVASGTLEK
jgi:hypothetical protein